MRKSGYRYYNDIRDLRFFVFITTFQPILKRRGFSMLKRKNCKTHDIKNLMGKRISDFYNQLKTSFAKENYYGKRNFS